MDEKTSKLPFLNIALFLVTLITTLLAGLSSRASIRWNIRG